MSQTVKNLPAMQETQVNKSGIGAIEPTASEQMVGEKKELTWSGLWVLLDPGAQMMSSGLFPDLLALLISCSFILGFSSP